jgi:hypothetical protein
VFIAEQVVLAHRQIGFAARRVSDLGVGLSRARAGEEHRLRAAGPRFHDTIPAIVEQLLQELSEATGMWGFSIAQ